MKDIHLLDLINGASGALDYVSSTVTGHHRRVGVGAVAVGGAMGLGLRDTTDLLNASLLHDIGAFSLDLRLDGLDFDTDHTDHARAGYRLLKLHPILDRVAELVLLHHTPWRRLPAYRDPMVPLLANIVNLVDRVDVLNHKGPRRIDRQRIRETIRANAGAIFAPEAVTAFLDLSASAAFWDRMSAPWDHVREGIDTPLADDVIPHDQLIQFSRFFSLIIDFRSRHTATHSQGVAETAATLARLTGMTGQDQERIRLAANLHDIGKLAVPVVLLDKPSTLTPDEFATVRHHASVCETILHTVPGLEDIADWASQHHERTDGSGYPRGLSRDQLSLGSRVMGVADVFTAITEDRPYRQGMTPAQSTAVLRDMARTGSLDADLVTLLLDNFKTMAEVRHAVQEAALARFEQFRAA
ncbi:MAG: HD domain-containing protein [Pseudodesulfovibrio sp.]|uniref:Metal-dependent phosphohydrolase HD sub domain protein n=1 Tax=Pseudodesulfovibrio aespoeensis (strain ATCC 700646 / DSM 10631 / Aspo-2) TaxID=643562 RepID=E6VVP4_PSEA9|nr:MULTISPECIES: HD domain-containing phosphohydrolase [Pseudodesulfovibrio]MBU4192275.1 HD domain-containing protein [Pseudomonadota bacterium]ADU61246.1 metal-dependent phosphohydrolase HD sub domain protein [Pseudodesulfovibrio aespoeensis Aspo-2]MBU4245100.1 HD domain-containing protein [Pseudomonadota bacterium]MBU4379578.1 HD domain-containing protein [Pseudomonadota bacterium]MBU4474302.1 HD domain-containing protein [Pseudomonadota bacterium]